MAADQPGSASAAISTHAASAVATVSRAGTSSAEPIAAQAQHSSHNGGSALASTATIQPAARELRLERVLEPPA